MKNKAIEEGRNIRAKIDFYDKWAGVKCPIGHAVTTIKFDKYFAGSLAESELGQWSHQRPNLYDRLATKCVETHEILKEVGK